MYFKISNKREKCAVIKGNQKGGGKLRACWRSTQKHVSASEY